MWDLQSALSKQANAQSQQQEGCCLQDIDDQILHAHSLPKTFEFFTLHSSFFT